MEIFNHDLSKFNGEVAIEPQADLPQCRIWPSPLISRVIQGTVRIPNMSQEAIKRSKSQHIAQLRKVTSPQPTPDSDAEPPPTATPLAISKQPTSQMFSAKIHLDPDNILCKDEKLAFSDFIIQFDLYSLPTLGFIITRVITFVQD